MNLSANSTTDSDAAQLIWMIGSPFLLVLGTVGNSMCIFVLSRRHVWDSLVSWYLAFLALADLLALYTGLLPFWVMQTFGTTLHNESPFICKVGHWIVYFSLDLSAWVLVSFTVERAVSVRKPLHVRQIMTKRVFLITMVSIVLILIVINGHFLIGYDVSVVDRMTCNSTSKEYDNFVKKFAWIDLFLFCIGPLLCQLIGNSVIIKGLRNSGRLVNVSDTGVITATLKRNRQIAITLLSVNAVYLVCTLPISIFLIIDNSGDEVEIPQEDTWNACLSLLMYLNNAINFITYMVSSRRFRGKIWTALRGESLREANTSFSNLRGSRSTLSSTVNLGSTVSVSVI